MTYDPKMVLAALKALRLATNRYAQARQKGEIGDSMLRLERDMLISRKQLRDLLNVVFGTIPEAKRPDDHLAQLQMVAERVNWSNKNLMLYRALEKFIDELMREDSGGEKSALWAKLLEKTLPHRKQKSACEGNPPKLPPIEEDDLSACKGNTSNLPPIEEDDFERIEPDVDEDWEVVEADEISEITDEANGISEITDEAYVQLLYGNLIGAYDPYYDFIHEEVV